MATFAQEISQPALANQASGVDDADDVSQLLDLRQDVAGDEDRLALRGQRAQGLAHGDDASRVEAVGRLVEQEQLRIGQQGRGDAQPLLHAQRVTAGLVPTPLGQAHQAQHLVHARGRDSRARGGQRTQVVAP